MHKRFSVYVSLWLLCLGIMIALTASLSGQTIISGDITGTVTDPTGATVPNAGVTLTSADSGLIQTVTTDSTGVSGFRCCVPEFINCRSPRQDLRRLRRRSRRSLVKLYWPM